MSRDSFYIQYVEYRKDLKSLPSTSPVYKKIKEKINKLLAEAKEKYGQDLVDEVTKGKVKNKPKDKKKKNNKCAFPDCKNIGESKGVNTLGEIRRRKWCRHHSKGAGKEEREEYIKSLKKKS